MKLYYSQTSPYARKARLAIGFKGLTDQVTQIACNPFVDSPSATHQNPLGKIPTLILSDNSVLFDSPVICEYLDQQSAQNTLYPDHQHDWLAVRKAEALGDGILDAAYHIVLEQRRPEHLISHASIAQWTREIERALVYAQPMIEQLDTAVSQAHIVFYCLFGYLDFRLAKQIDWRTITSLKVQQWVTAFGNSHAFVEESRPA